MLTVQGWRRDRARRLRVNDAGVLAADVVASNRVIHVIDKVLLPDG